MAISGQRGAILITSLWIVAILSILAIGIGFRVSLELRLARYGMDRLKSLYLAEAGIFKSQEILSKDANEYDSIYECGIDLSEYYTGLPFADRLGAIFKDSKLGEGSYSVSYSEEGTEFYGMMDEERKININTASQEVLQNLFGAGSEELVASILFWRNTPIAVGPNDDIYYEGLEYPYACKKDKFEVIEELLLVRHMTPEIFNSVKDYITVYGEGEVNINTAPKKVFMALGMPEQLADKIVEFRNGNDAQKGTADDEVFLTVDIDQPYSELNPKSSRIYDQLIDPEKQIIANIKNSFTIKSNYFRIDSKAVVDGSKIGKRALSIVARPENEGAPKLLFYHEY